MSKVTAYYHIVFCTKYRDMTLPLAHQEDIRRFMRHIIVENKCELHNMGGIENHLHLLINLHPSVRLADLVKELKSKSSGWMQSDSRFPRFIGWAAEYYGCSISPEIRQRVSDYIDRQVEHHKGVSIDDEFITLYKYAGQQYDLRDMR